MLPESPPVVLAAHGSRDPAAAATTRALARVVAALRPGLDVRVCFLELAPPRPAEVLSALADAGGPAPVVVPLLLTKAFHGRVDLPAQVADFDVTITDTLGEPSEPLLRALSRRLVAATDSFDAVVLAAAGTRVVEARGTVTDVAAALALRSGCPVEVAWASAAGPTGAEAVAALRDRGARRVAVSAYFLAQGRLYDTVVASALAGGAIGVAEPLGASWDLARLILARVDAATQARVAQLAAA
ncbi:sirohydrochlorin ferrochelatase [Allocatelliglobosispora scoriae]|uniref:Sirohydrochlorin ferrochelatase n=1 Tax=Allocatelliglobosispora scoriae TaxID=643052 RepID=A0A841BXB5_9ACTN|nr:CbiX/SirB N-terminal domain-containing protein [Allocatelliglobosispora scoriae]MBB5871789.1 sirohydrochlorin ferrochelatase [Allocatelliglobosispora scoriae]